jgi:hypothetical protein
VSTIGGRAGVPGSQDGTGSAARFDIQNGVAVDSARNLYVADYGNDTIRLGAPLSGVSPTVITSPQGQTAQFGSSVTFTVTVSGSLPLGYQWLFNGANTSDNTRVTGSRAAALTINGLMMGDSGAYQVVVTNAYGAVASQLAVLTVEPPPPPVVLPGDLMVGPSGAFTLSFLGLPNATYSILASTNLLDWILLGPASQPASGQFQFTDPTTSKPAARYYRIRWP